MTTTAEEKTLLEIQQGIAEFPEEARVQINSIAMTMRNIIKQGPLAEVAFALVGAEMAAQK